MTTDNVLIIIVLLWFLVILFKGNFMFGEEGEDHIEIDDYIEWEKYIYLAGKSGQKNLKIFPGRIKDPEINEKNATVKEKRISQGQGITVYFKRRWIQGLFLGVKDKALKILSETGEILYITPSDIDTLRVYNI